MRIGDGENCWNKNKCGNGGKKYIVLKARIAGTKINVGTEVKSILF